MMVLQDSLNQQVAQFPEAGRQLLSQIVTAPAFAGKIPANQVGKLAEQMAVSIEELMDRLVPIARCYAHPPISNYSVGSVVRGASGSLYFGGNLEFLGMGLNLTVHGEQAAVVNARLHGETGLDALAVNGTPCGHCRQFLAEVNNPDLAIIYQQGDSKPLSAVLPNAFMPLALGNERGMLDPVHPAPCLALESEDDLTKAAVEMAHNSYAPYSKNRSAIAVRLSHGRIVAAPYLESVAFNPSLSPLQNALVALRMGQRPWGDIQDAVLVEQKGSLCSHEQITRALLATLGDAELRVYAI